MAQPVYEIENLVYCYQQNHKAIDIHSLVIPRSSITGIMGPNGSGKSTLLKIMAFIDKPASGKILFNGEPAAPFSNNSRFRVTLLTQEPYLMKRSVYSNIVYGLNIRGEKTHQKEKVLEALSMVGLDGENFIHRQWDELSGGETQRVAMAARLILKPEVLFLDEPTAGVDAESIQLIKDAALNAREEWGTTIVVAGHDREWLHEICDNILHMFRGRIIGKSRENILFGPWETSKDGLWEKPLQDGQKIVVNAPPAEDAAAVIDSGAITISSDPVMKGNAKNFLSGTVTRLMLEKETPCITAVISVSTISFNVRLTAEDAKAGDLFPGRKVTLFLDANP